MISTEENGVIFEINKENNTAKIIYSPNSKGNIIIPKSIKYNSKEYKIASISKGSFKDNKNIRSINFSEDSELLLIESKAFFCSSLQSITLPASLNKLQENWCAFTLDLNHISISPKNKFYSILDDKIIIGKSNSTLSNNDYDDLIFACRNISTAFIPSYIKRISSYAFNGCVNLRSIEISEDSELEFIGHKSFGSSSLQSIYIPEKVTTIEDGWCTFTFYLKKVTISPKNRYFKYIENSSQKLIVGKTNKESDDFDTIVFACRDICRAIIPSKIKKISSFSFQSCLELNKIEFEENSELDNIGKFAFSRASFDEIKIPPLVHSIEEFAFCNCICLQKVDFSKSSKLISIKKNAFENTGLTSIVIPASVEEIEEMSFNNCKMLSSIEFFEGSQLHSIGNAAFGQTSIQKIVLPRHVTHIGEEVFLNVGVQLSIEFDDDCEIEFFDKKSFKSDSIVKMTIPKSVKELKDGWCEFTPSLTKIIISPENENLTYISNNQKLVAQKSDQINSGYDTLVFASRDIRSAVVPSFIKRIASNSFEECKLLKSIEFEKDSELESIGNFAFKYDSIKKVSIPSKVKFIGEFAFFRCSKLASVEFEISSDLISIGKCAFSHSIIKKVSIPENINDVGIEAFNSCNFLNAVEIFGETFSIGKFCFDYCEKLTIFSMPNAKNVSMSKNAFSNRLENLTIYALANAKITVF